MSARQRSALIMTVGLGTTLSTGPIHVANHWFRASKPSARSSETGEAVVGRKDRIISEVRDETLRCSVGYCSLRCFQGIFKIAVLLLSLDSMSPRKSCHDLASSYSTAAFKKKAKRLAVARGLAQQALLKRPQVYGVQVRRG